MINVAVQQGAPAAVVVESRSTNGPFNYPSPSLSARFRHNVQQQNSPNLAREVYQTVIVPTVFPSGQGQRSSAAASQKRQSQTGPSIFYQPQCFVIGPTNNNNNDVGQTCPNSYQQGPTYQQWTASPTQGYSFMQQQLHQYRQQQQPQQQQRLIMSSDRSYAHRGLSTFLPNGNVAIQIGLRSPVLQPHRTANVRNFESPSNPVAPMASNSQVVASPSPKRSSSRRHHHGHHHHYHQGQTSGGGYDLLESEALQRRHRFPTNFCRVLRECPPPVPPILLRTMPGASASNGGKAPPTALPRYKDPANRLKVTIRVLSSASTTTDGGAGSPEASFLAVDSRKKQLTLMEQAQQSQRQTLSSTSQQQQGVSSTAVVPKIFGFDAVFSPDDSQTEICSTTLTDIVQTVVNDGDGCVLMFGSSDQGKIQTAIGGDSSAQTLGILPCAVSWLYRLITEIRQRTGARFSIRVSAVEVAGPQEDLRDLLADLAGVANAGADSSNGYEACLREDPVFGTQLHNVSELRAPTPDKAAFYLDAALAKRRAGTEEERRNSHFFYTLHIYQYRVNEQSNADAVGVAGGRTRLHLVDLGAGEKSSKAGRVSLTLPALGNVLLTLLQGQKHLPFKESKVTQILKSCIGSASCKAVSVVACASGDPERRMESVNVVQIAGRLYRIRRTKRGSGKFGFGAGNSSGGESSTDDRAGGRRRFPRSASDPDCTTSSSEQSCDTVIYLGAGGTRSKTGSAVGGVPTSVAISDQDITPAFEQATSRPAPVVHGGAVPKSYDSPKKAPATNRQSPSGGNGNKQMVFVQPVPNSAAASNGGKSCEQWIDGPKASKQAKLVYGSNENSAVIENAKATFSAAAMDPFKREMIRQWVVHQEQERGAFNNGGTGEVWIDRSPKPAPDLLPVGSFDGTGARPKQFVTNFGQRQVVQENQDDRASTHSVSMETSSSARSTSSCSDVAVQETRDVGLQCCEEEIDFECGRYQIPLALLNANEMTVLDAAPDHAYAYQHNNNTINQEYAAVGTWTEPEMRMLEDIAEVEEEEITTSTTSEGTSMAASKHSSSLRAAILVAAASGSPPYRNEAMAPRPAAADDGDISVLLTAPSTSSLQSLTHGTAEFEEEHPLRILSKERMVGGGSRSDTFSLDNDDVTDAFSLPTSEMFVFFGGRQSMVASGLRYKHSADEDSSSLTDEDLERAMQASLTSIRSHEILEKLKSENKLRRMNEKREDDENSAKGDENDDDGEFSEKMLSRKSSYGRSARPEPEGLNDDETEKSPRKLLSTRGEQVSIFRNAQQSSLISDKLTKPTVPQLAKPVANLVTSQLISGLATNSMNKEEKSEATSNRNAIQKQLHSFAQKAQSTTPAPISVLANDDQENRVSTPSPVPHSSLPRPTKLPSPRCQEKIYAQQLPTPKIQIVKQQKESGKAPMKNEKEKAKAIKPSQNNGVKGSIKPSTPPTSSTASPTANSASEKSKTKSTSSGSVLKSPIMSFLKSPSKFRRTTPAVSNSSASTKATTPTSPVNQPAVADGGASSIPPTTTTCVSKRASSGYDSGHDSGIVSVDSPDLLLASPYSKITKPRASQRSSSGHGSDNSSAVSSDAGNVGGVKLGKVCLTKLAPSVTKKSTPLIGGRMTTKKASTADTGCASSSGYESATGRGRGLSADEMTAAAVVTTSPESGSDVDQAPWTMTTAQDRLRSPPSVKLHRKKWLDGFGFDASKSRSAPQSPNGAVASAPSTSRLHRTLQSQYAAETSLDGQPSFKGIDVKQQRVSAVETLKMRQRELKRELKQAKERLGVPPSKWSYDLHIADCMDTMNPNVLEALQQETRILEKRVAACKSHVLMVTVFDAVPSVAASPDAAKKCT